MQANPFDLSGKIALVTGASRGLGQYFARALARAGADLIITSRDPAALGPFQKEIEALGRKAWPLALDVRDQDSIRNMAEAAAACGGKIDILVNNAGCNVRKPALEITWDDWNLVLDTNLRGTFFVAQAVAQPHGGPEIRAHYQRGFRHLRGRLCRAWVLTGRAAAASSSLP